MTIEAVPLPDEEAYALCLEAIRARREKLERLRGDLVRLRQELARFEVLCHARVGDLVAELRRVATAVTEAQVRLEALLATVDRLTEDAVDAVLEGLDLEHDLDIDRVGAGADRSFDDLGSGPPPAPSGASPSDLSTLKRLYRDLAKRCHPDLAGSPEERERRAVLMRRVNEAFSEGNADLLRALLHETEADEPGFAERTVAEKLRWARTELARLDREAAALRKDLLALHVSDLFRLWRRHEAGEAIFDELEDDLERRIRQEGGRLDRLNATHRRLVSERGLLSAS